MPDWHTPPGAGRTRRLIRETSPEFETKAEAKDVMEYTLREMVDLGIVEVVPGPDGKPAHRLTEFERRLDKDQVIALFESLDDLSDTKH